jgi:hypothetical protein
MRPSSPPEASDRVVAEIRDGGVALSEQLPNPMVFLPVRAGPSPTVRWQSVGKCLDPAILRLSS